MTTPGPSFSSLTCFPLFRPRVIGLPSNSENAESLAQGSQAKWRGRELCHSRALIGSAVWYGWLSPLRLSTQDRLGREIGLRLNN